jgi:6-phosphogluconolactonase (cycloisomerase 2 family)
MVDVTITPNIPTYHGTVTSFSIDPPLPAGLSLHPLVGAIFGTPAASEPRTVHTVTASNESGSAHFALTITVVAPPRFLYTLSDDATISIFRDDPLTGAIVRKGFLPAGANESGPERIVIHPNQRFVYVPNATTNNISVYTLAPVSGWLTAGTPVDTGLGEHRMVIDPAGKFAYVSCRISDEIRVYSIAPTTGALTPVGTPVNAGTQPSALVLDRTGKFLFVTLHGDPSTGDGSAVATFTVDAMTGMLAQTGVISLASSKPVDVALDDVTNEIYVIEEATNNIAALRFDGTSGALTSVGVHATGIQPSSVVSRPGGGGFVYVANADPTAEHGTISIFKTVAGTGDLSPAGTTDCGKFPNAIAIDPTGSFANVTCHDSNDLTQFKIAGDTGALTSQNELVTRTGPVHAAIVTAGHIQTITPRFAYVANGGANDISSFTIDPATGNLVEILPTVMTGTAPVSLAIDPLERYLYVANQLSSNISIFSPSLATGTLFEVAPTAGTSGHPTHVAIEPSGRFVYLCCRGQANPDVGLIISYAIDAGSGGLSPIDVQFVDPRPTCIEVDPTGQHLYVACSGLDDGTGADILRFDLPVATGIPTNPTHSDATPSISSTGFHPNGKYLYAMLKGAANTAKQFDVDPVTGALTLLPLDVQTGVEPAAIDVTNDGRFAYIAYSNSNGFGHVAAFHVDPMNGNLMTPPDFALDGPHPSALALDPIDRILYVTNYGTNNVSVMAINPDSGDLAVGTPTMCGVGPTSIVVLGVSQ